MGQWYLSGTTACLRFSILMTALSPMRLRHECLVCSENSQSPSMLVNRYAQALLVHVCLRMGILLCSEWLHLPEFGLPCVHPVYFSLLSQLGSLTSRVLLQV